MHSIHKKTVDNIINHLKSKSLIKLKDENEINEIIVSTRNESLSKDPGLVKRINEIASRDKRLTDASVDPSSPPEELESWEEGYSDLYKRFNRESRELRSIYREHKIEYRQQMEFLKLKVGELEEQLSSLQAKITD